MLETQILLFRSELYYGRGEVFTAMLLNVRFILDVLPCQLVSGPSYCIRQVIILGYMRFKVLTAVNLPDYTAPYYITRNTLSQIEVQLQNSVRVNINSQSPNWNFLGIWSAYQALRGIGTYRSTLRFPVPEIFYFTINMKSDLKTELQ
jgi:hypothetical protein